MDVMGAVQAGAVAVIVVTCVAAVVLMVWGMTEYGPRLSTRGTVVLYGSIALGFIAASVVLGATGAFASTR